MAIARPTYDILIRNRRVFDGTGQTEGRRGDVAIKGTRIAVLGGGLEGTAGQSIEAEGRAVAPGFIEIKTHSDFTLPINPQAQSKVRQGVTTVTPNRPLLSCSPSPHRARKRGAWASREARPLPSVLTPRRRPTMLATGDRYVTSA